MKYIVLVGDGMADYPIKELEDRTPLEAARTCPKKQGERMLRAALSKIGSLCAGSSPCIRLGKGPCWYHPMP